MIELQSKPSLARGCRLRESEGAATLQIPEGQINLNGSGLAIIKLCDGQRSVAQIVQSLVERYPSAPREQIQVETQTFLRRLNERAALTLL